MINTASLYSRTFSQHVYDERAPRDAGGFPFALSTRRALDQGRRASVSETGPDTPVYPVYLTATKLLLMRCVSSVSEAGADTQCIWCIWGPQPVYLPSRSLTPPPKNPEYARRARAPPRESGADLRDSVDAIVVCHVSEITSK